MEEACDICAVNCVIKMKWAGRKKKKENIGGDFADHEAARGRGGVMEWEGSRSRGIPSIRETLLPATGPQGATRGDLSCCVNAVYMGHVCAEFTKAKP